jgi:hypothetical protein
MKMDHITFMVPNLSINFLVMGFCSCIGVVWQSTNLGTIIKTETMAIKMSNNGMVRFFSQLLICWSLRSTISNGLYK